MRIFSGKYIHWIVYQEIYEIVNFNESTCDLYTMAYISQSPTHYSKGNLEYVLQCTKFLDKQTNGYIFQKKSSSIKQLYMKLGDFFKKKGRISTHALCLIMMS